MRKIHIVYLFVIISLVFGCSPKKSDEVTPKLDLEKVTGKYQLTSEESIRLNETRVWTITRINDNHIKIDEVLTTDPNSNKSKTVNRSFDNIEVKAYSFGTRLNLDDVKLEDPEHTVNGHKNYQIFGIATIQGNNLLVSLSFKDLSKVEHNPPPHHEFMELEKIE